MFKKYNWEQIQIDYNSGLTYRDLQKKYGICSAALFKARKRGDLKTRNMSEAMQLACKAKPRKHSKETKKKISLIRKKYLEKNPDKVPYRLNHSSKRSIPELIFENALKRNNILGWISEYPVGIYQYDFAFLDQKLDVEIDGNTHSQEKVKEIDKRRDEQAKQKGWRVLRIPATNVIKNVNMCLEKLLEVLSLPPI